MIYSNETRNRNKAEKASNPTAGHIATLDANGNPVDSGHTLNEYVTDVSGKLDAPSTAGTAGQVLTSDGQGGQSWQTPSGGSSGGGSGSGDVSGKADKANPVFTGSVSMGRKSGSAVGSNSTALGEEVIANGDNSFVHGQYNKPDSYAYWEEWQQNTGYTIGDKVCVPETEQGSTVYKGYQCREDHISGSTFNSAYWILLSGIIACAEIVGNGTSDSDRSNARVLDWDGNERLKGWLYVDCNADSSGGKRVATQLDVSMKANKASNATNGNFAELDANGNLKDSGHKHGDYLEAPSTVGTSGQVLTSDGQGGQSWQTPSGGSGGSSAIMTGADGTNAGTSGLVPAPTATDNTKFLRGDGSWGDGGRPMVILSYGNSTWNDFITAYKANVIVYCRASTGNNPASGSQTRMAFMAYVSDATNPTSVEFQYYRSVNAHTVNQQVDQVFIYKLESTNGGKWTVTTREAASKIVAGANLSSSYSGGVLTILGNYSAMTGADGTNAGTSGLVPAPASGDNNKFLKGDGTWSEISGIPAPSSANSGDFLCYNGSAWVAQTLSTWQGGNY